MLSQRENSQTYIRLKADANYTHSHGSLDFGAAANWRRMKYQTDGLSSNLDTDNANLYLTYTHSFNDNYSLAAGSAFEYYVSRTDEKSLHQFLPSFNLTANLNFCNDVYSHITYQGRTTRPNQRLLDPNGVWQDSVVYCCGNPQLRSGIAHSLNASLSLWNFELSYHLAANTNEVSQSFDYDGSHIISSFMNTCVTSHTAELFYSKPFVFSSGAMLSLQGKVAYNLRSISAGTTDRHAHFFTGFARVSLWSQNFPNNITLTWAKSDSKTIDLYSTTESGSGGLDLTASHNWFGGRLGMTLYYLFPLDWGVNRSVRYRMDTPLYQKTACQDWFVHIRNTFRLSVAYRFAKGRTVKKKNNEQNIEYKGNWTM